MKGKLILRKAENLKEGHKVIWSNHVYTIVDKLIAGKLEFTLGFAHDIESFQQFHIEYQEFIKRTPEMLKEYSKAIETLAKNESKLLFVTSDAIIKSLPLSFDDYSEALKIGENKEVEFDIIENRVFSGGLIPMGEIGGKGNRLMEYSFARLIVKEEKKEIWEEMDADMEDSGMAQGEIESCINHWKNKYIITRKQ